MARPRCFAFAAWITHRLNLRRRWRRSFKGPLAKQIRAALASFRKLNDLTGDAFDDEIVSIRKSEGDAGISNATPMLGLGIEVLAAKNIGMDTRISPLV